MSVVGLTELNWNLQPGGWVCPECYESGKVGSDSLSALRADNARLRERAEKAEAEAKLWRPLTDEGAAKALDEAEAVPMSDSEIAAIVKRATDPAERLPNSEQAQLVIRLRDLERMRPLVKTLATILEHKEIRPDLAAGTRDRLLAECHRCFE